MATSLERLVYGNYETPWNQYTALTRSGPELADTVQFVEKVFKDTVKSDTYGNSSSGSSPRQCEADATFPSGFAFQFSKLNEPASLYLHSAESEYLGTEGGYPNPNTGSTTLGSERGNPGNSHLHPSQSPRQNVRHHPYPRKGCQTSRTYPQSDLDEVDALSTYSQSNYHYSTEQYHPTLPNYAHENSSINPQDLTVSSSQPAQVYRDSYSSTAVEPSLSLFYATVPHDYKLSIEARSYLSSDAEDAVPQNYSDEENEAAVAQRVRNNLKKGSLKKSNLRKGKKCSAKGSIKGVQKSSEVKADKSVRAKKSKDRHVCEHSPCTQICNNASELRKHMQVKHLRPFKCTFSFAGCDHIFGAKNEWKRHVTSQHMYLAYWQCNLSLCKDRQAAFNRKDLLGQHLKRMHVPPVKKTDSYGLEGKKKSAVEQDRIERDRWIREEIPVIQDRCFKFLRDPPSKSNCEICNSQFSGSKCWETKMEHVGKHYENGDQLAHDAPYTDQGLIAWALEHGIIEERDSYESSSNTSESGNLARSFTETSHSVHKALMESHCKYQFTKSNQFISRSDCHDQSPIRKPDNPLPPNEDLSLQTADYLEMSHIFDDFNDVPPVDHDTDILFRAGNLILP